jgi:hypothetical protein
MPSTNSKTAEVLFTEAFERLKVNKPNILPTETPVTQNNVAREADRNPSALRKERYPRLILEIQAWVRSLEEQNESKKRTNDNRTRSMKQKLEDYKRQRDKLSSIVAAQNEYIKDLLEEVEQLKANKVVEFK